MVIAHERRAGCQNLVRDFAVRHEAGIDVAAPLAVNSGNEFLAVVAGEYNGTVLRGDELEDEI